MSSFAEFDLSQIHPQSFLDRISKVKVCDFARPPVPGASFSQFLNSLPGILAGSQISEIAKSIVNARAAGRAVIVSLGGHVIKTGLAPMLIALMERGLISAIAINGAVAIHDAEIALFGSTSEDVEGGLLDGTFGMARETAQFYNSAINTGVDKGLGMGESLSAGLAQREPVYASFSLLCSAHRLGIPVTVHVAFGTDIMHIHPNADAARYGEGTMRDFRILIERMRGLASGGVLLNLGSAVVLPEVLLKAVAVLRNQDPVGFTDFLGVNFDFIQHYRSNQQVVSRIKSIGGRGIALTGHHEIMIPLLAQATVELFENNREAKA